MGSFIRFAYPSALSLQLDRHEFLAGVPAHRDFGAALSEVGDADAAEQTGDAVIHTRQRLFDGAAVGQVAGSVAGAAGGDKERPVNGVNDFEGGDFARALYQGIDTAHAGMGAQDADLRQPLQDLGEQLGRDVVGLGDVPGAEGGRVRVLGEIFERHEAVIGFFGEPEHNSPVYQVYGEGKANSMRD